jgi:threonine synthase
MAASAITKTNGIAISVSDDAILSAQKMAGQQFGVLIELAAADSLAGFLKVQDSKPLSKNKKYMLLFTGNGLKDSQSLERWNSVPEIKTGVEWKDILIG